MCVSNFSNAELVLLASSLSIAIAEEYDSNDLSKLSAFFSALGDNLAILSL